jgi:hypothetical protein
VIDLLTFFIVTLLKVLKINTYGDPLAGYILIRQDVFYYFQTGNEAGN